MRILLIAERLPSPLGGGAARQYNLIRCLSKPHQYTVVSFAYPEDRQYYTVQSVHESDPPALVDLVERLEVVTLSTPVMESHSKFFWQVNAWRRAFFDLYPLRGQFSDPQTSPQARQFRQILSHLLSTEKFDLIQVHQTYMMALLPQTSLPILLDMHDILSAYEYDVMRSKNKLTHRLQAWLEAQKMVALEKASLRRAKLCITVSEVDRQKLINRRIPTTQVFVIPNGVDIVTFTPSASPIREHQLIFTGSMNYPPNIEAVRWFYEEIFPRVQAKYPEVCWQIVGWQPADDIQMMHQPPTIEVTGYVDDIRPYLANSSVVVVPIRLGSGTRLKILDAWAMGKAIVSTRLGAEGLEALDGSNILLADEPQQFADYIVHLLRSPEARSSLGEAGRRTVESHYSWQTISQRLEAVYQSLRTS